MALLGSLQVRLGLDTATFSQKFGGFQKDIQRRASGFQRSMRGLTSLGSIVGGAGLTMGLKSVVDAASTFESQMQGVKAVMASLTGDEFVELGKKARELGASTRYSASEAASAIEMLAKNGLSAKDILGGALDASLAMAAATGAELPQAADIATDAMLVFGKTAADMVDVVNQISGVTQNSKFDINGYQGALAAGGAAAVKAGKSYEEFNAVITATAGFFSSGESAGTAFKVFTDMLVKDTKKAEKAQELLGIKFFDNAGKLKDFSEIAEGLKKGLAGLSDEDAISSLTNIFGTRGANFAVAMAKAGAEGINMAGANIKLADASAQAATRLEGLQGKLIVMKSAMEGLKLAIADAGLLDFLGMLAGRATAFAVRFAKLPDWMKNFGLALGFAAASLPFVAIGLSAVAGVLPILAAGLGGVTTFLLGPWGLALAAAGAAVGGFAALTGGGFDKIKAGLKSLTEENKPAVDALKERWADAGARLRETLSGIEETFADLRKSSNETAIASADDGRIFANSWGEFFTGIVVAGDLALEGIVELVSSAWNALTELGYSVAGMVDKFIALIKQMGADIREAAIIINEELIAALIKLKGWLDNVKGAVTGFSNRIEDAFDGLQRKGSAKLKSLGAAIADTTKKLTGFGDAGERETDRAVGNSWLTDLCEKGAAQFRALVAGGIEPAREAMSEFGREGEKLKLPDVPATVISLPDPSVYRELNSYAANFENAWSISLRNTQDAMDELVRTGKLSFKGLVSSILADLASAQLKKAVSSLFYGVAGMFDGTSSGGWGGVVGGVLKAFGSFDGGGYTGDGSRTGGMDGKGGRLAILHPQETVIDHTKVSRRGGGSGGREVNLSVPIHLQPGVSREELAQILPEVQRQIIQVIPELIQRGGRYAAAFGQ